MVETPQTGTVRVFGLHAYFLIAGLKETMQPMLQIINYTFWNNIHAAPLTIHHAPQKIGPIRAPLFNFQPLPSSLIF